MSNKSYLTVTESDPLAVQAEKQQDSPSTHGQVIPQIQEFLLRGGNIYNNYLEVHFLYV